MVLDASYPPLLIYRCATRPPLWRTERAMRRFVERYAKDRRAADRISLRTPLRVRVWKSAIPERTPESEDLSEQGMFFATDLALRVGQ